MTPDEIQKDRDAGTLIDKLEAILNYRGGFREERQAILDAIRKIEALTAENAALKEQLAESERQRDVARTEALEEAAQGCDVEADSYDEAVKWGGSKKYIADCKAASYAIRDRAAAIRALIKEDRT